MGSGNSRMGSRPSESRLKRRLSFLICGGRGSTSYSPFEPEEHPQKSPISSIENLAPVSDVSRSSIAESSPIFDSEPGINSSKTESGASSESNNDSIEDTFAEYALGNVEAGSHKTCLSKGKESVSHQVSYHCNSKNENMEKNKHTASCSYKEHPSQESLSGNARVTSVAAVEAHDLVNGSVPLVISEDTHASSVSQERENINPDGDSVEINRGEVVVSNNSHSRSLLVVSESGANFQLPGDYTARLMATLSPGLLVSDTEENGRSGGVLHVDVVSISSNSLSSSISEISNRETRRNSRRLFWDAISRHSFRRHSDSPTIVFATGLADDLGSHDRWLLDLSGDLHYDGVGRGSGYLGRGHRRNERNWLTSESSERFLGGLHARGQQTAFCASGLHPDGTCSCDSFFMAEESSTLASISRIVMLAEALFEVLDEIHRQPLSLSMLSLPAPESVVDSFPLKHHKKLDMAENGRNDDGKQCYICLAEYEEGDKLRVLPCHHEYHMSCVDKWLKEINGVCPLCRCSVCEGAGQDSVSNTEIPFQ